MSVIEQRFEPDDFRAGRDITIGEIHAHLPQFIQKSCGETFGVALQHSTRIINALEVLHFFLENELQTGTVTHMVNSVDRSSCVNALRGLHPTLSREKFEEAGLNEEDFGLFKDWLREYCKRNNHQSLN